MVINIFAGKEFTIVGPRGRNLSHWYTGLSEEDVIDMIQLIKNMFKIRKTFCYGYSMGGYGTWHMTFLHPEFFDGAIIIAGQPNHINEHREDDLRNYIGRAKKIPFLVIHGIEDHSIPIVITDKFLINLKEAEYNIVYKRVHGGGHMDIFPTLKEVATQWLKQQQ